MADFQFKALDRDVDAKPEQVALPRTLEITVTEAHQIFPPGAGAPANRLLIFAGSIEFGRDSEPDQEDSINQEVNEEAEVDEGERRTIRLRLRDPDTATDRVEGSASIAAPGNVFLAGNHAGVPGVLPDVFGANVANALATIVDNDLLLLSDVVAELGCQMNRMPYQANALVQVAPRKPGHHRLGRTRHGKEY
jgi:hypothetical protein